MGIQSFWLRGETSNQEERNPINQDRMSRYGDRDRSYGDRDRGSSGGGSRFGGRGGGGSSLKGKQPGGNLRAVNWDRIDLKPFEKNFYNATSASRNMDPRMVEQFRNENEITIVKSGNAV